MAFWNDLVDWLGFGGHSHDDFNEADSTTIAHDPFTDHACLINPATNLPMLDGYGCGGVDVGGSPFGMDIHHHEENFSSSSSYSTDDWPSSSDWNEPFST